MKTLMNTIKTKRYHLILEEQDLIRVLKVLNEHKIIRNMAVGNCGWADTNKWFIHFDAKEKQWNSIREELKVIRVWETNEIPKDSIGVIYSTD